jgi:hypothetical protein
LGHYPDNVMTALKETIVSVFWTKRSAEALLRRCGVPAGIMRLWDPSQAKYVVVSPILDAVNDRPDGLGCLRRLLQETLSYKDGSHLLRFKDGTRLKRDAERGLEHLRLVVAQHDADVQRRRRERDALRESREKAAQEVDLLAGLSRIRERFNAAYFSDDAQRRGYELEGIIRELLDLFGLQPGGSFRRDGEQIDGSFSLDGEHYLLEAKWTRKPSDLQALRDLDLAVGTSLDNTLGLFLSFNGFTPEALKGYLVGHRPRIICMDGPDLMAVLEGHVALPDLLRQKKAFAARERRVFVPFRDFA